MSDTTKAATLPEEFSAGLAGGRLLIQTCGNCGKPNMYPRYRCPFCQSDDLGWQEAQGNGTLMSWAVVRAVPPAGFEDELPYAVGVVRLDEGVQLLARLDPDAAGDWNEYKCDMRVRFAPRSAEQIAKRPTAWFTRDAEGDGR
jgi:uncharacterized OB-fold protein